MPIKRNNSDSYPGANSVFAPPVTKADCCLFQDVQSMMAHAAAEGWPATVKGGKCMVDASLAQIQTVCLIGVPTITSVEPDPIDGEFGYLINGTNFGAVEGEVWFGSAATWAGSGVKVKQSVSLWGAALLSMNVPTMNGLGYAPAHVYLYVFNDCGQANAVGFETEVTEPPP